ncbi:hypothetical protein P6F26_13920 [Roseibacterium sp. SDUM158017]|uniref:hypothetical protein n=1 Tax=Roseicyclus salinarum TaxID=3036773 RepID=UPI00241525A7|nr:hypothetical protein [Roseibacterium sp. SDUM158017]MDG4649536.1 hypothetical protein [Roseibacterium sp. SDUM158017]
MTRHVFIASCGMAAVLGAAPAAATSYAHETAAANSVVTVSCFRGPWEEVIWDRPNAVFVDSLVAIGYNFPEAHAIAERVCRDEATVGDPEAAAAVMRRILADNPPGR